MLVVCTAEPGSATARLRPILAGWDVKAFPSIEPGPVCRRRSR